jgi:hypothetical protein
MTAGDDERPADRARECPFIWANRLKADPVLLFDLTMCRSWDFIRHWVPEIGRLGWKLSSMICSFWSVDQCRRRRAMPVISSMRR